MTIEENLQDAIDLKMTETGVAFQVLVMNGRVQIPFNRRVRGLSLSPQEARDMAKLLRICASRIEGVY